MKKTIFSLFFAFSMIITVAFMGDIGTTQNPFAAHGQTVTVKKKRVGAIRKIYRGGKYVGRKVWTGTKWVGVKSWQGTKYVGRKTWKGTKYVGRKVKRAVY
jgi:hypothetical protein